MKLLVNQMMGKLCKWLRILGYDTELNTYADFKIVRQKCLNEKRIFITKSKKNIDMLSGITSLVIPNDNPDEQLKFILGYLHPDIEEVRRNVLRPFNLFSRCLECNELVVKKDKEFMKERIPEKSYTYYNNFFECPKCMKVYWQGTHYYNTINKLERIMRRD